MALISLTNISKVYQMGAVAVNALYSIDLTIKQGELVSIIGRSGSGKTTLLDVIGCLSSPTSGEYFLDGASVSSLSDVDMAKIRNQSFGFIFQTFHLLPRQTARENVALPLLYNGASKEERRARAQEALQQVGLSNREHHLPRELSGGQQQRVAIARALVNRPKIILADEPTGNLDSKSGDEIIDILLELNQRGHTVILVTHDVEIAHRLTRKIMIADGRIVQDV
ncbi:MAG: ABC transporter ATP-binding protein [Nitrospirae bacterium]|nr:ABC transporter ATP-binding protein [Candidatus Troglogloeales bacterium]